MPLIAYTPLCQALVNRKKQIRVERIETARSVPARKYSTSTGPPMPVAPEVRPDAPPVIRVPRGWAAPLRPTPSASSATAASTSAEIAQRIGSAGTTTSSTAPSGMPTSAPAQR